MWVVISSVNKKKEPAPMKKPFNFLNYRPTKDRKVLLTPRVIRNAG
jgi:hypothetical protein